MSDELRQALSCLFSRRIRTILVDDHPQFDYMEATIRVTKEPKSDQLLPCELAAMGAICENTPKAWKDFVATVLATRLGFRSDRQTLALAAVMNNDDASWAMLADYLMERYQPVEVEFNVPLPVGIWFFSKIKTRDLCATRNPSGGFLISRSYTDPGKCTAAILLDRFDNFAVQADHVLNNSNPVPASPPGSLGLEDEWHPRYQWSITAEAVQ